MLNSSSKSICFILPSLKSGGMERVASKIANYLVRSSSVKVSLILLSKQEVFYKLDEKVNLIEPSNWIYKRNLVFRYLLLLFFIRSNIKKIKPDAIFSFGESYNAFAIFSTLFLNIPIYVSNRASPLSNMKGFRGTVNPFFYPLANGVLIQTQRGIEILKSKYHSTRFLKVGNPFDIPQIKEFESREKIILNVGYLGGKKNQDLLINYFKEVSSDDEWKLYFIGDGPNFNKLKIKIEEMNFIDKVSLLGMKKNINEFYSNSQIFAFTSTSEGFPNALGEAMAAGCACISFDCITGPSELIDDGINGFLIPEMDHHQYKEKLKLLMENDELRERFGKAARKKIEENFSIEKIGKKYLDFIT